jgi:hypothetical protein
MGARSFQDRQAVICGPLEQVAQIVTVGVEGPAAVAGQKAIAANSASPIRSGSFVSMTA